MARSTIDPISRIEGHLRVEMEVDNGTVQDAWVSAGAFRGMELVLEGRTPQDAVQIVQRICGVCPISHGHAAALAGEEDYGLQISNNARIIRNILEGAQFLHSHILWFYNMAGLDYINPLNALNANVGDAYDLITSQGLSTDTDLQSLYERLSAFAENGQLSIFSGNWFDADDGTAYRLTPEVDLICTAHYMEALKIQALASQISAIIGGKMPHVMTVRPGGTTFVPTPEKLAELKNLADQIYNWVSNTVIQDTVAIARSYPDAFNWGKGCGRYLAWGVFDRPDFDPYDRYLPRGTVDDQLRVHEADPDKVKEYLGSSWYEGSDDLNPREEVTRPNYTNYNVNDRYTWNKAPSYDGLTYEATSMSRVMVAYLRNVPFFREHVDDFLTQLGQEPGNLSALQCTMGRTGIRQIETLYVATLMRDWINELDEAVKSGDSEYFREPETLHGDHEGLGLWEAPRGALYHYEHTHNGVIDRYQIVIPTTWNIAPHRDGNPGPLEQALIGVPVDDIDKPINALRTVHSFDPCTSCAVHISEPSTGKHFETVTNPWGVK